MRTKRVVVQLFCTVTAVSMRTMLLVVLYYDMGGEKCRLFRAWNGIPVKNVPDVYLLKCEVPLILEVNFFVAPEQKLRDSNISIIARYMS